MAKILNQQNNFKNLIISYSVSIVTFKRDAVINKIKYRVSE